MTIAKISVTSPCYEDDSAREIAYLRSCGVSAEDIELACKLRQAQQRAGAPILSLRAIVGLDDNNEQPIPFAATPAARLLAAAASPTPRPKGGLHITKKPIRGGSIQVGSVAEHDFVRPLGFDERRTLKAACYKAFELGRELAAAARAGRQDLTAEEWMLIGFTRTARDILLKLLDTEKFRRGHVYPTYETIMTWAACSRRTAARALATLRSLGLVQWIRRFVYSKAADGLYTSSPTSNRYRFELPRWLAKRLDISTPAAPDDHTWAREDELARHAEALATLPARQLAASLRSIGSADSLAVALFSHTRVLKPKCQTDTQPHSTFNYLEKDAMNWPGRPIRSP